jgi:hypothetical protein
VVSRPPDEAALVARAKRGDAAACAELVRMHQDIAFRIAYLVTHDAADAEEAAQDGFVKAYRALHRFRDGAPHAFFFVGPSGAIVTGSLRLARNTLVWQRGDVVLRIEGQLTRAQALELASRLR